MTRAILLSVSALALVAAGPVSANPAQNGVDPEELRATVLKLTRFGTRHTLSSPTDPKRGIGAARKWAASRFTAITKACGGCLVTEMPSQRFEGPRAPAGVDVVDVLGIQRGTGDPNHVIIVAGHIDSRATDAMDFTSDAPGANDDGSGTALVLEAARVLSREKHKATIVYAILSGEEQGLWGGRLLAKVAKERGWKVAAMLNNDIVGNTIGVDGRRVEDRVRVFSEGIRFSETSDAARERRGNGGEDDGPSRSLAKTIARVAKQQVKNGLDPFLVRRPDRFSRGGDHLPMLEAGFPAVRFSVGVENYDAQHQDVRTEKGRAYGDTIDRMDFPYLAKITALNIAVIRELANAPLAPEKVTLDGAVSADTLVSWTPASGAAGYRVRWRRADRQEWEEFRDVKADVTKTNLTGIIVDDTFFGVSALSAEGRESTITFGGAGPR